MTGRVAASTRRSTIQASWRTSARSTSSRTRSSGHAVEGADDLHRCFAGVQRARRACPSTRRTTARFATWSTSIRPKAATRRCCRRTRASANWRSTRRTDRFGASAISTVCARSSGWSRRPPIGRAFVTFPSGTVVYDLDVSPRPARRSSTAFGEIDGKMDVRVFSARTLFEGRHQRGHALRFRPVGAVRASSSPGRTLRLPHVLSHRRLQRLPLRGGHRRDRSGQQHRNRVLPAHSAGRRSARWCSASPGRDWCPPVSPPRQSRTRRRSRSRRAAGGGKARGAVMDRRLAAKIPWETLPKKDGI